MTSTNGRKRRQLPDSLQVGLRGLGFHEMQGTPEDLPWQWRHPLHPRIKVAVVASNIAGSDDVIHETSDGGTTLAGRRDVDSLLRVIASMVARASGANAFMGLQANPVYASVADERSGSLAGHHNSSADQRIIHPRESRYTVSDTQNPEPGIDEGEVARARAILAEAGLAASPEPTQPTQPIPTAHAERVADVAADTGTGMTTEAITQLIEEARGSLGVEETKKPLTVEASDPALVNALVAAADDLAAQAKPFVDKRTEITDILKTMLGDNEVLTVNGVEVFTNKRSESRVLDVEQLAKLFPDLPENSELWTDKTSRRTAYK